jgi:hypothetical protein
VWIAVTAFVVAYVLIATERIPKTVAALAGVGVLRWTGVFEYLAIWAAKRAKGSPLRVLVLLVLITAVASALLDNVTTVLLIAPVTLLVCERTPCSSWNRRSSPCSAPASSSSSPGASRGTTSRAWNGHPAVLRRAVRHGRRPRGNRGHDEPMVAELAATIPDPGHAIVTLITIALAAPYLWLRYFVLG